jgi:hypothetical protein
VDVIARNSKRALVIKNAKGGSDLAKNIFAAHGVIEHGPNRQKNVVKRKQYGVLPLSVSIEWKHAPRAPLDAKLQIWGAATDCCSS